MIFNSLEFLIFLVITYTIYRLLPFRGQNILLLIASYIFYGWWDERFLYLIILTTVINFSCALMINRGRMSAFERWFPSVYLLLAAFFFVTVRWKAITIGSNLLDMSVAWDKLLPTSPLGWWVWWSTVGLVALGNFLYPYVTGFNEQQRRRFFIWFSVCFNLSILGVFKYFNFFIDSAEGVLHSLNFNAQLFDLSLVLPVGISFYTFQTMTYTIDVYRGTMEATTNFPNLALFISFFPQLLAGPIERASRMLPQISNPRTINFDQSIRGLYLILLGLFKKIAIADSIAKSVNAIYGTSGQVSWLDVVLATLLFTIQVYCDFAGYSDVARGIAKLFGFELMVNFNLPYFSKNPSEFWQRWHISLSTWLRDYLYITLGGNRQGNLMTYRNLMLTMVLGGLWHGAAWNFVLWGFYQGALLCIYRAYNRIFPMKQFFQKTLIGSIITTVFFFILTCYGWLLFKANSFEQIVSFTTILFTDIGNFSLSLPKPTLAGLLGVPLLVVYEFIKYRMGNVHFYLNYSTIIRGAFCALLTLAILMGISNEPEQFIYFQF